MISATPAGVALIRFLEILCERFEQLRHSDGSSFAYVGQRIADHCHIGLPGIDQIDRYVATCVMYQRRSGIDRQRCAHNHQNIFHPLLILSLKILLGHMKYNPAVIGNRMIAIIRSSTFKTFLIARNFIIRRFCQTQP